MATVTPTIESVFSALLTELIRGELTDETIAAVDRINADDAPEPLKEVIRFMHGMTTVPYLRYSVTSMLIHILGGELAEMADFRDKNAPPIEYPPLEQ